MKNTDKDVVKDTLRVLTILVGMISVVSFVQRLFDVGVIAVAQDLLEYYRAIAHLIFAAPIKLLNIKVPPGLTDAWTLSFIGASAYARTENIEQSRFLRRYPGIICKKYWRVGFLFLFGISGLGLVVLVSALTPNTYVDEFHEEPLDLMKEAARNTLYIFVGTLVFFAFNALAPAA